MKKNYIHMIALCLATLFCLAFPIHATSSASDYIDSYNIIVYTSGKQISTEFYVDANKKAEKVGAYEIKIYEYPYSSSNLVDSKDEFDTGMTKTNSYGHSNTITYTGQSNKNYKVVVTVFARDASGSDSRTKTYYVST